MGRKANPALIGGFVVGAIALAVIGLLVFGSGQMFKHTVTYVCFFPGAVDGLNLGAPVKLKGVEIGTVTDIGLRFGEMSGKVIDAEEVSRGIRIPVTIQIERDKVGERGANTANFGDPANLKRLVNLGLRAQLNSQSMVTGLLFVQLDLKPGTPATLVMPEGSKPDEIPTVPTAMEQMQSAAQQIMRKLEDLHVERLVQSASEAVEGISQVVNSPGLKRALETLPDTMANVNQAVTSLRELSTGLDSKDGPLLDSLKGTSDKASAAMEQARLTLQSVQALADPNSALAGQLTSSLQEIASAARAMRLLADYLERNPSALVRGKDTTTR